MVYPVKAATSPASLAQLWTNNAYFERQRYVTPYSGSTCPAYCNPVHEVAPVQKDSQTIYMYYRDYYDFYQSNPNTTSSPSNGEIGLAVSTDRGYQREQGKRNVLLTGFTPTSLAGSDTSIQDPYLYVWRANSQCNTYHNVGRLDTTTSPASWTAQTNLDPQGYMCYGPFVQLPAGEYDVNFRNKEDVVQCIICVNTIQHGIYDNSSSPPSFVLTHDISRPDFLTPDTYNQFDYQFSPIPAHRYEFTTWYYDTALIHQDLIFARWLGGFDISTGLTSITMTPGATASVDVTVTSLSSFSGVVEATESFSSTCFLPVPPGPTSDVKVPAGGAVHTILYFEVSPTPCPSGNYFVTVTGVDAVLVGGAVQLQNHSNSAVFIVVINAGPPDFTISASPTSLSIPQAGSGTSTITLTGGFSGTVTLYAAESPQTYNFVACFHGSTCSGVTDSVNVTMTPGALASVTLTIVMGFCSASPGSYAVAITGTSSSPQISHSIIIPITVPAPNTCDGGGASLAYGTLITMPDGSQTPVQNLRIGDTMLGYDVTTGRYVNSAVASIRVVHASNMLVINTAAGTPLRVDASPTEILWTKLTNGTALWLPVTELTPGDSLFTQNGWVEVTSIQSATGGTHNMYDVTATFAYFANGYLDPPMPS